MKKKNKSNVVRVSDLLERLRTLAPFDLAESWDNVGLICGDSMARVTGIVVGVNLGRETLDAAAETGANLVICHHPPIFKAALRITRESHPFLLEAIRKGVAVVALHTNFDLASHPLNKSLCEELGGGYVGALANRGSSGTPDSDRFAKFVTFVPETHLERVRTAVAEAGAGHIGNYSHCTFSSPGEGTFWGHEKTKPAIGRAGRLEKVSEIRLETIIPWRLRESIVDAASRAHPYEEMAYDVYEMHLPTTRLPRKTGYGFVGKAQGKTQFVFHKFLRRVKKAFRIQDTVVVGPALKNDKFFVRKYAFSPGSGSAFVGAAIAKGVDTYICGEVGYHQMLDAKRAGMTLILLGHSNSERFFVETTAKWCTGALRGVGTVKKIFETVHEVR